MKYFGDGRDWFFQKRFGMFVHWGIYSLGGLHEQELQRLHGDPDEYWQRIHQFDPVKFDPTQWIAMARSAGMEYMVVTAKHHDGFCMWDTAETDFKITNTPYGKDVIGMLAEECHRQDFPLVIYYSVVDWHHSAYPNIGRHHELKTDPAKHDVPAYLDFLKKQIAELCSNYGEIHGIWWDMNVPGWEDGEIHAMIRRLQPNAVINNRGFGPGDFSTPERNWVTVPNLPFDTPVEACDSIGINSWGFRKEEDYHSLYYLKQKIARFLALNGNFLLNAGPRPDGTFPPEAVRIFAELGKWYRKVKDALCASPCYGLVKDPSILCTGGGDTLNVILTERLTASTARLKPLNLEPESVTLLNDGSSISWTHDPTVYELVADPTPYLRLREIPADALEGDVPVLTLKFPGADLRGIEQTEKPQEKTICSAG